jgi:hypothetical protein
MAAKFTLKFRRTNATFETVAGDAFECSRILHDIARRIVGGDSMGGVRDLNGNVIGKWEMEG